MNTLLYMVNGMNIGASEVMIISLGIFIVFLIVRNIIVQPKK